MKVLALLALLALVLMLAGSRGMPRAAMNAALAADGNEDGR